MSGLLAVLSARQPGKRDIYIDIEKSSYFFSLLIRKFLNICQKCCIRPLITFKEYDMTRKQSMPPELVRTISRLGEHIRIARKRRAITMDEMASRMYVTRKTLSRLENGEPGVSVGILGLALWVLGLDQNILTIADPEQDKVGTFLDRQRLPQRVRRRIRENEDELDF